MDEKNIKLTFLGDALCDEALVNILDCYKDSQGQLNMHRLFAPLKSLLCNSDYVMANMETPLSDDMEELTNKRWQYCTHISYAQALKDSGVDYVSTANNHCLDRGLHGLYSTIDCLRQVGLDYSGTYKTGEPRKPLIVEVKGLRLGVLSYTYGTNAMVNREYLRFRDRKAVNLLQEQEGTIAPLDPLVWYLRRRPGGRVQQFRDKICCLLWPENKDRQWFEWETWGGYRRRLMAKDIRYFKEKGVDKIIVFAHIGGQYNREPNSFTIRTTKWLEAQNVDFVIANHEHVIHGSKVNNGQLTTYALGNLLASAGTVEPPFGRRAEYSVAVHAYVGAETKRVNRITYTILKTVHTDKNTFEVWPVYDLLKTLNPEEAACVLSDSMQCAEDFSGTLPGALEPELLLYKC